MSEEIAKRRRKFFEENNVTDPTNDKSQLNLAALPNEILEQIFHFLPAKFICNDVNATCKRLHNITKTPIFWHTYLKVCKNYEPISQRTVEAEPWKRAFAFEHEEERWKTNQSLLRYRLAQAHGATVDTLKIHETKAGERFAITGSRDRSIILWNINNIVKNETDQTTWRTSALSAHTGWVWDVQVSQNDKTVFSCGFDSMLKQWEIVDGSLLPIRQHHNNNEALLKCIVNNDNLYTSTYTGKILVSDVRIGIEPQRVVQMPGRAPLNCMESLTDSNYIYALSTQSGNLFCIDKRRMEIVKRSTHYKHCVSIDCDSDSLVVSFKDGKIRYLNPTTLKTEYTWNCPASDQIKSVNPLRLSKGAFIYGNSYELMIYTPGRNPQLLGKLPTKEMIISVDYNNGDLACGMSEGVVQFWPRENQKFPIVD